MRGETVKFKDIDTYYLKFPETIIRTKTVLLHAQDNIFINILVSNRVPLPENEASVRVLTIGV